MSSKNNDYQSDELWAISRQSFIKTLLISGVALQLPWLSSCSEPEAIPINTDPLNKEEYRSLLAIQNILFPSDGNGPGAKEINAGPYFLWVMRDINFDQEISNLLIDNLQKFDVECEKEEGYRFHELSISNQEEFLEKMIELSWVRKWCSRLLTLIFEALLLDPIYNINPNEIGWEWLEHVPGQPRPSSELIYPNTLK